MVNEAERISDMTMNPQDQQRLAEAQSLLYKSREECKKKDERIESLEYALRLIMEIRPSNALGPMSDRVRRIAREALE